jgi:hypothetical protein
MLRRWPVFDPLYLIHNKESERKKWREEEESEGKWEQEFI